MKVNDNISDVEPIITDENHHILSDGEASIITKKADISDKIKNDNPSKRYSTLSRDEEVVMSRKKKSIDSTIRNYAMNLKNIKSTNIDTLVEADNTKMSQTFKPLSLGNSKKFERLHSQPRYSGVSSPFLAADFRGLLLTDYKEALNNCEGNYRTLSKIEGDGLARTRIRIGKYKSNATKEMFPSPYDLTKFNMSHNSKLKKNFKISHHTAQGFYSPKNNE